jgi:hypothetical protein
MRLVDSGEATIMHSVRARRCALALAAVLAGAALAGCGSLQEATTSAESVTSENGTPGPAYVVEIPTEQATMVSDLRAAYERFAGDFTTHQAVEVINAYAHNADQQECVEAAGLEWTPGWRGAIQPVSTWQWHTGNIDLTPPTRIVSYDNVLNASAASLQPLLRIPPEASLGRVLDECSFQIDSAGPLLGAMSQEQIGDLIAPDVVADLNERWSAAMAAAVEGEGDESSDIEACFTDSDLSGALGEIEPGRAGEHWWEHVGTAVDAAQPPGPDEDASDSSASWAAATKQEADLVIALWHCHSASYGEDLAAASAAADTFGEDYRAEIAEAEAAWAKVEAVAEKMGWAPADPLAGLTASELDSMTEAR